MFSYSLTYKVIPDSIEYLHQLKVLNPSIQTIAIDSQSQTIEIISSTEIYGGELAILNAVVPANTPVQKLVERSINSAIIFGQRLVVEFAAENVLLGITQANKTNSVRKATAEVVGALATGSLYDAIAECRDVPVESYDSTFVTAARLLLFVNKIEDYLGMPLSTEL